MGESNGSWIDNIVEAIFRALMTAFWSALIFAIFLASAFDVDGSVVWLVSVIFGVIAGGIVGFLTVFKGWVLR